MILLFLRIQAACGVAGCLVPVLVALYEGYARRTSAATATAVADTAPHSSLTISSLAAPISTPSAQEPHDNQVTFSNLPGSSLLVFPTALESIAANLLSNLHDATVQHPHQHGFVFSACTLGPAQQQLPKVTTHRAENYVDHYVLSEHAE